MRRMFGHSIVVLSLCLALAAVSSKRPVLAQAPPSPSPAAAAAPASAPVDSFAAERDSLMNAMLQSIKGREDAPAESVFRNIKLMKGAPAGRLLRVMNMGFGRSLGVSCLHCHVADKWDSEEKPAKQITREMMAMSRAINEEYLSKIKGLKSERPTINCTTCHRGQKKPALDLAAH